MNILTQNGELIETKSICMSPDYNLNHQCVGASFRANGNVIGSYKSWDQAELIVGEIEMAFASNKLIYAMPGLEGSRK